MIRSRKPMFLPHVMKTRNFRPLFRVTPDQNEVTFLLTQENRCKLLLNKFSEYAENLIHVFFPVK